MLIRFFSLTFVLFLPSVKGARCEAVQRPAAGVGVDRSVSGWTASPSRSGSKDTETATPVRGIFDDIGEDKKISTMTWQHSGVAIYPQTSLDLNPFSTI